MNDAARPPSDARVQAAFAAYVQYLIDLGRDATPSDRLDAMRAALLAGDCLEAEKKP